MNGKLRSALLVVLGVFLAIPGCNDAYEISTIINPDGSCERIITCTRENRGLPDGAFPLPTDTSWDTSWTSQQKEGESLRYTYTARKHFPSLDSLNREFSRARDSASFQITLDVDRHFRWFYTYYTYREQYARFNPFMLLPPDSMMSAEEIHRFMTEPRPDSLLQEKWKEWDNRNQMEFIFARLLAAVSERHDPTLTPSALVSKRLILFDAWKATGENPEKGMEKKEGKKNPDDEIADKLLRSMVRIFGAEEAKRIEPELNAAIQAWAKASDLAGRAKGSYKVAAVMPGTLIGTNAQTVEGNRVTWEFSQDQIATADIRMTAESRVVNFWTFLITAILVIMIIASPLVARLANRARKG